MAFGLKCHESAPAADPERLLSGAQIGIADFVAGEWEPQENPSHKLFTIKR